MGSSYIQQASSLSSFWDLSQDEYEERIVSALADGTDDDDDDDDDEDAKENNGVRNGHHHDNGEISKRSSIIKRKRRKRHRHKNSSTENSFKTERPDDKNNATDTIILQESTGTNRPTEIVQEQNEAASRMTTVVQECHDQLTSLVQQQQQQQQQQQTENKFIIPQEQQQSSKPESSFVPRPYNGTLTSQSQRELQQLRPNIKIPNGPPQDQQPVSLQQQEKQPVQFTQPQRVFMFSRYPKKPKQQQLQQQQRRATTSIANNNNNSMNSITPWIRKYVLSRPADSLVPVPRDYLADNFNLVRLAPVVEHLATRKQTKWKQTLSNDNVAVRDRLDMQKSLTRISNNHNDEQQQQQQQEQEQEQEDLKDHPYAMYKQALDLILCDNEPVKKPSPVVQYAAEILYGFVHARFVVSTRGLETMRQLLILHASSNPDSRHPLYGRCPRLQCDGMPLLPIGLSDDFDPDSGSHNHQSRAKRYCCKCRETFHCWDSKVDGSAWGTSACHLLLMVYGKEGLFPSHFSAPYKARRPSKLLNIQDNNKEDVLEECFKATDFGHIFGFPVHPSVTLD